MQGLKPISDEETLGQILTTLYSYQRYNIDCYDLESTELPSPINLKVFRSILILFNGEIVGTGSIWINSNDVQVAGNIGQLMISDAYCQSHELVHRILYCLESIAWEYGCGHTVLKGSSIRQYKDLVQDLDYQEHLRNYKMYYVKMRHCPK